MERMRSPFFHSKGFTILEVLIGLTIATIGFIAIGDMIINSGKIARNVTSRTDFNEQASLINLVLAGDPTVCGDSFKDPDGNPIKIDIPTGFTGKLSTPIKIGEISTTGNLLKVSSTKIATTTGAGSSEDSKPKNGWTTDLEIVSIDENTAPNYLVTLSFKKNLVAEKSEIGASMRHKEIPMAAVIDTATKQMVSCSNSPDEVRSMCSSLGATWNDVTRKCEPTVTLKSACENFGGTYNVGTEKCDLCTAIAGATLDPATGKCVIAGVTPPATPPTVCHNFSSSLYGALSNTSTLSCESGCYISGFQAYGGEHDSCSSTSLRRIEVTGVIPGGGSFAYGITDNACKSGRLCNARGTNASGIKPSTITVNFGNTAGSGGWCYNNTLSITCSPN